MKISFKVNKTELLKNDRTNEQGNSACRITLVPIEFPFDKASNLPKFENEWFPGGNEVKLLLPASDYDNFSIGQLFELIPIKE